MSLDLDLATELIRQTLMLALLVCAPVLAVGLVVGVIFSLAQAVTQIQEHTLSFIPKIAAMLIVAVLTLPWIGSHLMEFARGIFTQGLIP
jgi:flagellar biosynthetic protein FliQ